MSKALEPESALPFFGLGLTNFDFAVSTGNHDQAVPYLAQSALDFTIAIERLRPQATDETLSAEEKITARNDAWYCLRKLASDYRILEKIDECINAYEENLLGWESTPSEDIDAQRISASLYLLALIGLHKDAEAVTLLKRINNHPRSREPALLSLYSNWVEDGAKLVELASKTNSYEVFECFWKNAEHVLAHGGPDGETGAAR